VLSLRKSAYKRGRVRRGNGGEVGNEQRQRERMDTEIITAASEQRQTRGERKAIREEKQDLRRFPQHHFRRGRIAVAVAVLANRRGFNRHCLDVHAIHPAGNGSRHVLHR
jgi:hypothetical protein